jgi:protease I
MMTNDLSGLKIAFLAADGVEQVELESPWKAVAAAGASPQLVSLHGGMIQTFKHWDKSDQKKVDLVVNEANPDGYDALMLPGGVINGDNVRTDARAVRFVRRFVDSDKPVGVICHGSWVLAEAGVVRGRTLTSWPSLATDLRNAGANWVDREVVADRGLVSSRKPDDLSAFNLKLVEEISESANMTMAAGRA